MNNLVNFLKQSDIFYQFTPTQLELVANLCQEITFNSDEVIFQENMVPTIHKPILQVVPLML